MNKAQTSTALGIGAVLLLLAIPPIWPYGFYQLLRWVVAVIAALAAYSAYEEEKVGWVWVLGGAAVLFNPLVPIGLSKSTWVVLDLVVAGVFGGYIFALHQD